MIILKSIGLKLLSWLGGPLQWIAGLLVDRVIKWITGAIKSWLERRERAKQDKKSEEKYDETVKDDQATPEERRDAADDFLNRKP